MIKVVGKAICLGLCGILFAGAVSGCAFGESIPIGDAFTIGDSHATTTQDRKNTILVTDPDTGAEYMNVIKLVPVEGNDFDIKSFRSFIDEAGINWYQIVVDDNRSAPVVENAYLYFPASVTATDLINTQTYLINGGWNAAIMAPAEYQEFFDTVEGGFNSQITYYGPAAMNETQSES